MLYFNSKGLLTPNKNIASTIEELKKEFVLNISNNEQRQQLYDNYIQYSKDLKIACNGIELIQWVDGSFVTKKTIPKDIDVVTFIDYEIFLKYEKNLKQFIYPQSMDLYNIDGYIVVKYSRNNPNNILYISDKLYWMDRFDKTRRNRAGNIYPKGFIEINY